MYAALGTASTTTEGGSLFDHLQEREEHVLLERMEGNIPGYLSYSAREGEVICVFSSVIEAEQFYMQWRARSPGEGWGAVQLETEELIKVLQNFDLVSINPQPEAGATEYLYTVEDFIRTLRVSG
jgi:hypothetical protein